MENVNTRGRVVANQQAEMNNWEYQQQSALDDENGRCPRCNMGETDCVCPESPELPRELVRAEKRPMGAPEWQEPASQPLSDEDELQDADEEILGSAAAYRKYFEDQMRCNEEYEAPEHPDLEGYLAQFNLSPFQEIAVCRTYANYLSQRYRPKQAKPAESPARGGAKSKKAKK